MLSLLSLHAGQLDSVVAEFMCLSRPGHVVSNVIYAGRCGDPDKRDRDYQNIFINQPWQLNNSLLTLLPSINW